MAEKNIHVQALEKRDQKKGERSNDEASSEKISTEGHPVEVSPKEAACEQSHSVDVNLDKESMINSKPPQVTEAAQEPKPSQALEGTQETKPSQVTEAAQKPEPSQIIEAAQEPKQEEKGLGGFDLNQEGTCVGSASTPAAGAGLPVAKLLFDLNVVDGEGLENQILPPSDLHESPREVNYGRLNLDLNHWNDEGDALAWDLNHCIPSPPASPSPSSSSSSVPQPSMEEHFDKNGTEEPHIHNDSLLQGGAPDVSVFRIMGANVVISPERNKGGVPTTLPPPSNGKAPILFGRRLGGTAAGATCSPTAVDEPQLLPLFCSSSTGGLKRKEPEGGLEPYMAAKKVANSSSSTVGGKRKEPEGGQEPYVAGTKRACSL
ncbi:hypothetical protein ABKV19_019218 [Rosa sericea]